MAENEKVWTIVVAAGSGLRFGSAKQFERLGDRRVVDWAVDEARRHSLGVVTVVPAGNANGTNEVEGGATRSESVRRGLAEQMRMRETQHRARIMDGAAVHAVVTAHVRVGEELHEVAEHVGELTGERLHSIDARLRRAELMREMQPSHHQWSAVVEHDVGGL
ncbi:MAG: 2-C-methyl-D-erythritol 4-phosphate cytidylyltransferase, partial [Actinomycetota bacterium]